MHATKKNDGLTRIQLDNKWPGEGYADLRELTLAQRTLHRSAGAYSGSAKVALICRSLRWRSAPYASLGQLTLPRRVLRWPVHLLSASPATNLD